MIFALNAATLIWLLLFRRGKLTFMVRQERPKEAVQQQI